MRSILDSSSGGLLGALGPLLGSSWTSLGHPWGTKMVPKRVRIIGPRQFFLQLCLASYIFSIFDASWCLRGLSWEGFGPSGASLGRVFDPLGSSFSRIGGNIKGFLASLPLFVFTYCGSPVIQELSLQPLV